MTHLLGSDCRYPTPNSLKYKGQENKNTEGTKNFDRLTVLTIDLVGKAKVMFLLTLGKLGGAW